MRSLFNNLFFSDFYNFDNFFTKDFSKSIKGFILNENQYEFTTKLFAGTDIKNITAEVKDQYLHIYNKTENESNYSYIIVSVPSDLDVKSINTTYKNGVLKIVGDVDKSKTTTLTITE